MPRFILIDHSIADIGGHHYEYAAQVLHAAEKAGYSPILVTNRRFKAEETIPWPVHKVYRYGLWFHLAEPRWFRAQKYIRLFFQTLLFRLKCTLLFSPFGLAWAIGDRWGQYLRGHALGHSASISLFFFLPFVYGLSLWRSFKNLLKAIIPFSTYWRNLFRQSLIFLRSLLAPLRLLVIRPPDWAARWFYDMRRMRAFTQDTRRLFRQLKLTSEDIVFMPTISHIELLGLGSFFHRPSQLVTWHLLFRRNIYEGREASYTVQEGQLKPIRQAFLKFQKQWPVGNVHFYTDTEELTAQYNRLGIFLFKTLPIPHTPSPQARPSHEGPLRIIYVGDARKEKGYHLIPRIVQDLWTDYVESKKIIFTLQSNYNIPLGEPEAVIGRSQLENFPNDKVILLKEPLSSQQYRDLLLSGDINLLLYDRDNYYARSSGILAESLASGIPVVVPSGSWMARQFLGEVYRYQATLRQRMRTVKTYCDKELRWQAAPHYIDPAQVALAPPGDLVFTKNRALHCWLNVPSSATHVLLQLKFQRKPPEAVVTVNQFNKQNNIIGDDFPQLIEGDSNLEALVAISLKEGSYRIQLSINSLHALSSVSLNHIRVDFLSPLLSQSKPPLGCVGMIYHSEEEISTLLKEMIAKYDHYRDTANRFAQMWHARHNADNLIAELIRFSRQPHGESTVDHPLSEKQITTSKEELVP